MWDGKKKAITLSYDDGVLQDIRLVSILNRYGIKCTFNVNSGMLYHECVWKKDGLSIARMNADEIIKYFEGHEVAIHGLTHTNFQADGDIQTERQIVGDNVNLERILGRTVNGIAYPFGRETERAVQVCRNCGLKYGRKAGASRSFDIPENMLAFDPTINHSADDFLELTDQFLSMECTEPKLLFVWGHSYEFDLNDNWGILEEFCKMVSGRLDVFYGTNFDVLSPFLRNRG